jgi:hypothetical protein
MRRFLAALLLAATTVAAAADSIGVVDSRRLAAPEVANATHELSLHAHTFRGTRWQADDIASAVAESARLLAQCAVAVSAAELRVVQAPRTFHYFQTETSRRLLRAIDSPRPALFFVEDTWNVPAFDAEAIGLANSKSRPELANTVWVAHGARDLPYALAHEIVHVLSNSGEHSNEPRNLMRGETSPQNDRLTQAQCDTIRARGEENGLLRRRNRTN